MPPKRKLEKQKSTQKEKKKKVIVNITKHKQSTGELSGVLRTDQAIVNAIADYLSPVELGILGRVSKEYYWISRTQLKARIYLPRSPPPPLSLTLSNSTPDLGLIEVGGWHFLKDIDAQRSFPVAIASQSAFGDYRFASLSTGGTNNPFTLLDVNTTVGVVKINGYFFGQFLTRAYHNIFEEEDASEYEHSFKFGSGTHNHMEDHFLEAIDLLLNKEELRPVLKMLLAQSTDGDTLVITLKGTKSPCSKCAENLIGFIDEVHNKVEVGGKKIKVFLRCKAVGLYEGEKLEEQLKALGRLLNKRIPFLPWGVANRGGKVTTSRGLSHEFSNWKNDWKKEKVREYFVQLEDTKALKFFNFDKKDQFDSNYIVLRTAIYRSLSLFREYSLKIKST